uniref:Tudor domain-containing protein n=1 Tax=Ditylenchus dipsaci TaxID=166011 RepID=A0A915EK61_9BILA
MSGSESMVFNRSDMYDRTRAMIFDKVQNSGPSSKPSSAQPQTINQAARSWKVGELCMAPFAEDGKYYPAKISKLLDKNKTCEVVYTEYDTKAIVKLADLLSEDDVEYAAEDAATSDNAQTQQVVEASSSSSGPQQIFPIAQAGNDKEALTNMLMSWYMSGYHTAPMKDFFGSKLFQCDFSCAVRYKLNKPLDYAPRLLINEMIGEFKEVPAFAAH